MKLEFDLEVVENGIRGVSQSLDELVTWQSNLGDSFGEGWQSENATKINEKLASVKESIGTIRKNIENIKNQVEQYKTNVKNVDASINL